MENNTNVKLQKVLKKMLDPKFQIKNEIYLNQLLKHLTQKDKEMETTISVFTNISEQSIIVEWLKETARCWSDVNNRPKQEILIFALNLASFLCMDEYNFVYFNKDPHFENFIAQIKNMKEFKEKQAFQLSYIKLISSFLCHESGVQWTIATNNWIDIFIKIPKSPENIFKETNKYLIKFIYKSIIINEAAFERSMNIILEHLYTQFMDMHVMYDEVYRSVKSILKLLNELFFFLLERISESKDLETLNRVIEKIHMEATVKHLKSINEWSMFELDSLEIGIFMCKLSHKFGGEQTMEYTLYEKLSMDYRETCLDILSKYEVHVVLEYLYKIFLLVKNARRKFPVLLGYTRNSFVFENQVMILMTEPMLAANQELFPDILQKEDTDEMRQEFVSKVLKNSSPLTITMWYKWWDCLHTETIFKDAMLSVNYIILLKSHLDQEFANTIFQMLSYVLSDIVDAQIITPQKIPKTADFTKFVSTLISGIVIYIRDFNFSWRYTVETMNILDIAFKCLTFLWPENLMVKSLELVNVAICKYMSPNMALLIDKVHETVMGHLGPLLYAKLHDSSWEVRDSALEVVHTISSLASEKFPSYRKIILETAFPSLVIKIALKDAESFVRATALRCLEKMMKINEIWNSLPSDQTLEQLMQVLQFEPEGIVRTEAAAVLATVYACQEIPHKIRQQLYNIMSHAVISELHWEVKINALKFWNKHIEFHLTNQGMIDGSFPNMTFCKERGKIVTLNEHEIKRRLVKVLNQLAETGCLAVFVNALQDDCDIEVTKVASELISNFVDMLKKYNVVENDCILSDSSSAQSSSDSPSVSLFSVDEADFVMFTPPSSEHDSNIDSVLETSDLNLLESMLCVPTSEQVENETVMNGIVDASDLKLLENLFNTADMPPQNYTNVNSRNILSPNSFLKFLYNDFESHVSEKTNWIRDIDNLDSLLDDMLKEYEVGDVNNMDCY